MKLAFSTLGCPDWTWNEIITTAKDLKMSGVEIRGVEHKLYAPDFKIFSDERVGETKERLDGMGLQIPMLTSAACLGQEKDCEKEVMDYIACASKMGIPYVRVMVTPVAHPEQADLALAKRRYLDYCQRAKEQNVALLMETNGVLANSETMAGFMEGTDPVSGGVLWDIHHPYRFYGESPEKTFHHIGNYVKYIHVKDSVMVGDLVSYRMMGYGDVPVFDAMQILADGGYEGYITFEWLKRWFPDLTEPGIVFAHFASYMTYLFSQLEK